MREAMLIETEIDAEMKRKSKWNERIAYSFVAVWTEHFNVVVFHVALSVFLQFPLLRLHLYFTATTISFHNLI